VPQKTIFYPEPETPRISNQIDAAATGHKLIVDNSH